MNLLLDTCTFLWLTGQSASLSSHARRLCQDPANALFLSAVSVWEIELKYRKGKLGLVVEPTQYIPEQRQNHAIFPLPLDEASALRYVQLGSHHRDPFDRMLVCQAWEHELTILTPDRHIAAYDVAVDW